MTRRLRGWLDETHGVDFELLRHFVARFFDSELSGAGEWRKVAIGIFAALVSVAIVGVSSYMARYNAMEAAGLSAAQILREVRSDRLVMVGLVMGLTVLLT